MLQGAGASITVSVGRDGVLLDDSGSARGNQVLAAIRRLQQQLDLRDPLPIGGAERARALRVKHRAPPADSTSSTQVDPDHWGNEAPSRRQDVHRRKRGRQHRR
jgi:hypothetical protein